MSYDLHAKNKSLPTFHFGLFTWPMILNDSGMGYILGYGDSMKPGEYSYQPRKEASPVSNDGFKVTSAEAKAMAMVARGFISVNRFINKEWETLSPEDKLNNEQANVNYRGKRGNLYKTGWHEDHLKKLEQFADFAEKSQGFSIH